MLADEQLLVNVVDHLPLGVWIARAPNGELVFANRVFHEIMGMDARGDVALGEYAAPYGIYDESGVLYPESKMPFVRALEAKETITVDDIVIHRRDGRRVNIRATARPVKDEGGEITHVVIAFHDITVERQAEREKRELEKRRRENERLESLGKLAAGVAHDFNNVLASIQVIASRMRLSGDVAASSPQAIDDLRHIERAVGSAAELTRSLLTFGRADASRSVRFEATEVVRGVFDIVSRTFDRSIAVTFASSGFAFVRGDASRLEQVVMNLAVNARDAMPDGGALSIEVRPDADKREVVIEVADTGPGIPVAIRERIFEPYFTTKEEGVRRGTGLGLATVFGIVQAHRGSIDVRDADPHGARFTVRLPLLAPADGSATLVSAVGDDEPSVVDALSTDASRGRVLLVDDELLVRSAIRRALALAGYDVVEASDGAEALDLFRTQHESLRVALVDDVMPRIGGAELCARLRDISTAVPFVLMSGRVPIEVGDDIASRGIRAVLAKPFGMPELARALSLAVGGRQAEAR